ncbi:hypothetical protein [Mycoplasmopsis iners]|uniref:hypothetical protein n=1 Tax=Mycoplasmopsis iners TaxID=76630 RepID=UPI000495A903|nr:hypothetical protein [Mycoplasmopsis iners]
MKINEIEKVLRIHLLGHLSVFYKKAFAVKEQNSNHQPPHTLFYNDKYRLLDFLSLTQTMVCG